MSVKFTPKMGSMKMGTGKMSGSMGDKKMGGKMGKGA